MLFSVFVFSDVGTLTQRLRSRAADAARYARAGKNTTQYEGGREKSPMSLVQLAI